MQVRTTKADIGWRWLIRFAVAGQDAVPAALEFIFRQISKHPDVQSKLRLELLTSLPLSADDRTFAMIDTLSYLNAVVMEGLRLVDTISSYQTRIVPKGGCVISGHYLPAGVGGILFISLVHQRPDIDIDSDYCRSSALPDQPPGERLPKTKYI